MENQSTPLSSERPVFLTVICIISFVGLGLSIINSLFTLAFGSLTSSIYPLIQEGFEQALSEVDTSEPAAAVVVEEVFEAVLGLFDVLPWYAGLSVIFYGIALFGVIKMWNLQKTGFYLYAGVKFVLMLLPFLLMGVNIITSVMAVFVFIGAAIFITLYALNLRVMQ